MNVPPPGSRQRQFRQPPGYQLPGVPGMLHGYAGDPRYPSPRKLRRVFGFAVDWLVHVGCAVAVAVGSQQVPSLSHLPTVWAIVAWLVVSFVHRVPIQAAAGTTLGKALFGLCMIRQVDGGRPAIGQLAGTWIRGIWVSFVVVVDLLGASTAGDSVDEDKTFLPVVRSRDIR